MKKSRLFLFILCQFAWRIKSSAVLAQTPASIYSMRYVVSASSPSTSTRTILNRDDLVLIRVTGKATYGPLASGRLGAVNASGSTNQAYRTKWNRREYENENFGALICRIGKTLPYYTLKQDFRDCLTENFSMGTCPVSPDPIAGTLIQVKEAGEFWFAINDEWVYDNRGEFIVEMTVISSSKVTQQPGMFEQGVCSLLTTYNTNSFNATLMEDVALGRQPSSRLNGLPAYNAYYHFLDNHPTVQRAGIRWQQVAIETSGLLVTSKAIIDEIQRPSWNQTIDETKLVLLVSYLLLTSQYGKDFFQGVASAALLEDVNKNFFRPLIKGDIRVKSAFWFDATAVYAEQFNPGLQRYYQQFGFGDRLLIEGAFGRWFAKRPGCYTPSPEAFQGNMAISSPLDRVRIGLYKMGYSWMQINQVIGVITACQSRYLTYPSIINELKSKAIF